MPLRDHFHNTGILLNWERLHGHWPSAIVNRLNAILPEEFVASPRLHTGVAMELDISTHEREASEANDDSGSGLAVVTYAPATPLLLLDSDSPDPSEYEVNIYTQDEYRLVAAIAIISPSNKDRPESRRTFVNKCETLLKRGGCVVLVDVVTNRTANLYGELLDEVEARRTLIANAPIYAVTCRGLRKGKRWQLEGWEHELTVSGVLPTLPLWLDEKQAVPLELEATYVEACRTLRIR